MMPVCCMVYQVLHGKQELVHNVCNASNGEAHEPQEVNDDAFCICDDNRSMQEAS